MFWKIYVILSMFAIPALIYWAMLERETAKLWETLGQQSYETIRILREDLDRSIKALVNKRYDLPMTKPKKPKRKITQEK
jgi:hypothetical protein